MANDKTYYLFPPISESWVDQDAQGFVNDVVYAAVYSGDSQLQRLLKTGALNDLGIINSALQEDFTSSVRQFVGAYPAIRTASVSNINVVAVDRVVKVTAYMELESSSGRPMVRSLMTAEIPS